MKINAVIVNIKKNVLKFMMKNKMKKYNWFERIALKFINEYIKEYGDKFYFRFLLKSTYNPIRMIFVFIGCICLMIRINKIQKE